MNLLMLIILHIVYIKGENINMKIFSIPRNNIAITSLHQEIVFYAGGDFNYNPINYVNIVDIYNISTNNWTVSYLSVNRSFIAATSLTNMVFFAGGLNNNGSSNVVDYYNIETNQWNIIYLSKARYNIASASLENNNLIFFAGGLINGSPDSTLDIFDANTYTWNTQTLSFVMNGLTATALPKQNMVIFGLKKFNIGRRLLNLPISYFQIETYSVDTKLLSFQTIYNGVGNVNSNNVLFSLYNQGIYGFVSSNSISWHNSQNQLISKMANIDENTLSATILQNQSLVFLQSNNYITIVEYINSTEFQEINVISFLGQSVVYGTSLEKHGIVLFASQNQTFVFSKCPFGTFRTINPSNCIDCPIGNYCPQYFAGYFICPPGNYCPAKTYQPIQCPPGKYNNISGSASINDCLACPAGFYCPYGTSEPIACPSGKFCPFNFSYPIDCPLGTYNNKTNLMYETDCLACPAGFYCYNFGTIIPTICPQYTYCPIGTILPIDCPSGTYNEKEGSVNINDCFPCPAGYYCYKSVGRLQRNYILICPPGNYCPLGSSSPILCPITTYALNQGSSICLTCPEGYACPNLGTINPVICSVGLFCPNGSSSGIYCPQGTYNQNQGSKSISSCLLCPLGKYNGLEGQSKFDSCLNCPLGTYCFEGSSYPQPCPSNSYCPQSNQKIFCPEGTYFDGSSATSISSCKKCLSGYYCVGNGQSAVLCDTGTYASSIGSKNCEICPDGNYCANGASSPILCPKNTFATAGNGGCTQCPQGQFTRDVGQSVCESCPSSRFTVDGWWCMTSYEKIIFVLIWLGSIISGIITLLKIYNIIKERINKLKQKDIRITLLNIIFLKDTKNNNMEIPLTTTEGEDEPMLKEHNLEIKNMKEILLSLRNDLDVIKNTDILKINEVVKNLQNEISSLKNK